MTKPPEFTESLGFLLSDSARLLRKRFDQKARAVGQTRAQWQVLAYLTRYEGINQAGLADLLELEPITLCRLIDRMQDGGWVTRQDDPNDRRAKLLFMTDKARDIITEMRATAAGIYDEALQGLPDDARAQLLQTLSHIRANLAGN